jgi:hypothetical protein
MPPTIIHRTLLLLPKDMANTSTTPTVVSLDSKREVQGHMCSNIVSSKAQAMPSQNGR